MTSHDLEKYLAHRTYANATGMKVTFPSVEKERNDHRVKTTLPDGSVVSVDFFIQQEYETIYVTILENQYVFRLKEKDEEGILAFDLLQGDEVTHSFRLVS